MRQLSLGLLVLAASSLSACVAADATPLESTNDAVNEDFDDADTVEVSADRIVYPARVSKTKRVLDLVTRANNNVGGTFLVGKRANKARNGDGTLRDDVAYANGYLRRVTAVSNAANGDVVFETQKASLDEAREELVRQGYALDSNGCFPQSVNPFTAFHVDLSRSLYEKNIGSLGRMSIALKDSFLTVDGNLDTQVSGACLSPDAAHATLTLNMRGQVVLEGSFDGAFGAVTGEIPLFHKRVEITSVLGLPLALDFAVTGDCEFASNGKVRASVGGKVDGKLAGGATWARGEGFQTQFTPTWPQPSIIGPSFSTSANVNATCTVRAKALALVFDSDEGPYAQASTYLNLDATGSGTGSGGSVRAKLVGGVDANIGGTLKPFHITLVDEIHGPTFHREWPLFERTFSVGN